MNIDEAIEHAREVIYPNDVAGMVALIHEVSQELKAGENDG